MGRGEHEHLVSDRPCGRGAHSCSTAPLLLAALPQDTALLRGAGAGDRQFVGLPEQLDMGVGVEAHLERQRGSGKAHGLVRVHHLLSRPFQSPCLAAAMGKDPDLEAGK